MVFVRVKNNRFRILGRSLVNKREKTGLELKEVKRNSPLVALIEGGVSIYQAVQAEKRFKEVHELEMKIKKAELEKTEAELENQNLKNLELQLSISEKLKDAVNGTDIESIQRLKHSFMQIQLLKAYSIESANAAKVTTQQGLFPELDSIRINEKA